MAATLTAQITPSDDSYTASSALASNFGRNPLLDLQSGKTTVFIRFNVGSIPAGYNSTKIAKATLRLYVNPVTTAGSFNVNYVSGAWSESALTGNNQPALGPAIASGVAVTDNNANDFILVDVTSALDAWLNGTEANDGLALVADNPLNVTFDSKENTGTSHPPGAGCGVHGNRRHRSARTHRNPKE